MKFFKKKNGMDVSGIGPTIDPGCADTQRATRSQNNLHKNEWVQWMGKIAVGPEIGGGYPAGGGGCYDQKPLLPPF